jgi:NAD(P)-dependent dehydrogenase (short-subunit alcohol dehydrogenase family)
MTIRYDGKVAIVTGAGQGLGRSHAIELAKRGAKVVINDLGGAKDGTGGSSDAAKAVVTEIEALGGEAIANGANVAKYDEVEAMVKQTMDQWGRIDILVNNAGILRDKSFSKGSLDDFKLVVDVHLIGTVNCTKACWDIMRDQAYGRVVVTTSSSGLYGNFGQSNYGSAKMGVIGLMNTLVQEGSKYDIRVNALAPTAGTRMTEGLIPEKAFDHSRRKLSHPLCCTWSAKMLPTVLFLQPVPAPMRWPRLLKLTEHGCRPKSRRRKGLPRTGAPSPPLRAKRCHRPALSRQSNLPPRPPKAWVSS